MSINNYYTPQEYYVNTQNVSKIMFYPREKCDWLKWVDERYVKHWWSKEKELVRVAGFYDARKGFIPTKTECDWYGKCVYKLKELKDIEKNPYWCKFDGEYSDNYVDTEIFIRPYVEVTYNDGTIDRYWFWNDNELKEAKNKFFNLDAYNKIFGC